MLNRREFLAALECAALSAGLGFSPGCTRREESASQLIKTGCGICGRRCGMDVYVKDGEIVKIAGALDNPVSKSHLCAKGLAAKELVYAPDRLKYPLKKEANTWKRITWDEALSTISKRLQEGKRAYGAESLVVHTGKGLVGKETGAHVTKFCAVYGTPNRSSVGSQCHVAGAIAAALTYEDLPSADIKNTKCIIVWGSNPAVASPLRASAILEAKERGAKLIVIDPRFTPTAQSADLYLQIRPGTDCALALATLNVIISEHLYDEDFVKNWTVGLDELSRVVREYSPEKVGKLTGIPVKDIKKLSRMYGKTRPACIVHGNALQVQGNGVQTIRAIGILQAITGNLDIPGGEIFKHYPQRGDLMPGPTGPKPIGADQYPIWAERRRGAQANLLPSAILTGTPYPIKNMIVIGGNPALTGPNSRKWRDALKKLEFLVVMDLFMTETAKLAHIVLPATTFFEMEDIGAPQVIRAQRECWPDWKFIFELARKMDLGQFFWKDRPKEKKYKQYEKKGFNTPSGKVEIYSHRLKELGYDPVPIHHEPDESPISRPDLAKDYPLILISGARLPAYLHSQFHNLPSLRRLIPHPQMEIHEYMAKEMGIKDGEEVIVESKRGSIKTRAKITEGIHRQVVSISHGWNEANVNILTSDEDLDSISGFPPFNGLLCNVRKP